MEFIFQLSVSFILIVALKVPKMIFKKNSTPSHFGKNHGVFVNLLNSTQNGSWLTIVDLGHMQLCKKWHPSKKLSFFKLVTLLGPLFYSDATFVGKTPV